MFKVSIIDMDGVVVLSDSFHTREMAQEWGYERLSANRDHGFRIDIEEEQTKSYNINLIFSTTDENGDRAEERHVRHLIAGTAELYNVEGYTLNKSLTGYWQGKEEDSYTLNLIYTGSWYEETKAIAFVHAVSKAVKRHYKQGSTIMTLSELNIIGEL